MDIIGKKVPTIADFPIPMGYEDHESYYFYNPNEHEIYDAYDLFRFFNIYFFHNVLESSEVKWSDRMTLCAGTCQLQCPGSCLITLSKSLLQFRTSNELKETLVHEMIHAYLFITNPKACRDQGGHGKEFCEIMNNINAMTGLNITVYHSFHDEVEFLRKHVWKCNGPCQHKEPYYGIVRRATNRAPGPKDFWYQRHEQSCGGQWTKIEGPEFHPEEKKKEPNNKKRKPTVQSNDLNKYLKKTKISDNEIPKVYLYLLSDDEDEGIDSNHHRDVNPMNNHIPTNHDQNSNNLDKFMKTTESEESKGDFQKKLDSFSFKKEKTAEKKTGTLFDFLNKVPKKEETTEKKDPFLFSGETPEKSKNQEWNNSTVPTSAKSSVSKSLENKTIFSIFMRKENCKNSEKFWLRILINSEHSLENLLNIVDLICLPNAESNRLVFVGDKQLVFFNKSLSELDLSESGQLEDVTNGVQFKLEKIFFLAEVKNVNIMKAKHFPVCIGASFFKADGSPETDLQERIENINEMLISMF